MAAGEDHVSHIADQLVVLLRSKDPFIAPDQADIWGFQVKERKTQPIDASGTSSAYAMIDHQPPSWGLDRWVTQTNLVGIPPGAPACLEHQLVRTPMFQI